LCNNSRVFKWTDRLFLQVWTRNEFLLLTAATACLQAL
jgi:hypothetical protein